ncbi:hypothetical protein CK203_056864 [Vitis vinifera]|uniref:N-acetylglucosaminylphosphatidylinositol deacetylase n=1 Tax=Vitis vinifera TaxID=29760 RepID=A0A438GW72_VITVI|nr:hypothetical protein CK203_056864 [Vitis vinifera]
MRRHGAKHVRLPSYVEEFLSLSFVFMSVGTHCSDSFNGAQPQAGCSYMILQREILKHGNLSSTNILRKYSGPIDIWLSILSSMCYPSENMHCLLNENPHKSFLAMAQHQSQWVWFRKLFVSFSSYTYVNRLRKIK